VRPTIKRAVCVLASCWLAAAAAQEPAPAASPPAQPPERPALKLKLEEPVRSSQPRITFSPREGTPEPRAADTLPTLGGQPSAAYERPFKGDAPASPYPKDTTPGY